MITIRITIYDERKLVIVFVSSEEYNAEGFYDSIKPLFAVAEKKGYLPVILESGSGSLEDAIYHLLKRNYMGIAKDKDRYNKIIRKNSLQ